MNKKMLKQFCIMIFSILSIVTLGANYNLMVKISTKRPLVGEVVTISLSADKDLSLMSMPKMKNAKWLPNYSGSSTSIVNFRSRHTRTYAFRVTAKGEIKIPELKVSINGEVQKINPLQLRAVSAGDQRIEGDEGEEFKIKDIIWGKVEILNLNKEFYVGEKISLEISLLHWRQITAQVTSYPDINLDKIVFHEYRLQNQQLSRFLIKPESIVDLNGKKFIKQSFETAFRAIAPGTFKTKIRMATEMRLPTERRDFFGRPVYKRSPYVVEVPFEIKVKALPKAPKNYDFLGLVGNWDVNFSLLDKKFKVGDPLTLEMSVYGLGSLETLNVPALDVEGFRVYPPEVDKKKAYDGRERAEIKYVLIPFARGEKELKMSVSIFSSLLNKYKKFNFSKKIKIAKSTNPAENINYSSPSSSSALATQYQGKQEIPRSNILFLKTSSNGKIKVPLYLNWLWVYIVLGIIGPLAWLISEIRYRRQQQLGNNKGLQRRHNALKRKGKVLSAVKKSSNDDLNAIIQNEAVPFINDMLNLPPGTTTSELVSKLENDDLVECLTSVGESSYLPGTSNLNPKELRDKLYKALKCLTLLGFLFLMPRLGAAEKAKTTIPTCFKDAISAYDSGDFSSASQFFRSQIIKDAPDPNLLYNLGTSLCNESDLAGALVCFERAHLLLPYDSAITENLNFVRRRLFLGEVGKVDGPKEMLTAFIHSLRPDEWLLVAALAWAIAGVLLAFRRKLSPNKSIILVACCAIIFVAALGAYIFEKIDAYSHITAVVTSPDAQLRSLPTTASGHKLARLRMGTLVKINESRLGWVRINSDNANGWMLKNKITKIAPGNDLPPIKKSAKRIILQK